MPAGLELLSVGLAGLNNDKQSVLWLAGLSFSVSANGDEAFAAPINTTVNETGAWTRVKVADFKRDAKPDVAAGGKLKQRGDSLR